MHKIYAICFTENFVKRYVSLLANSDCACTIFTDVIVENYPARITLKPLSSALDLFSIVDNSTAKIILIVESDEVISAFCEEVATVTTIEHMYSRCNADCLHEIIGKIDKLS